MLEKLAANETDLVLIVSKINETIGHVRVLEAKLLSGEELDTKSGSGLDSGININ